jgi:hypothetical protein
MSSSVPSHDSQDSKSSAVHDQSPENGTPHTEQKHVSKLEDYEAAGDGRLPFVLSLAELKLLGIAGVSTLPSRTSISGRVTPLFLALCERN